MKRIPITATIASIGPFILFGCTSMSPGAGFDDVANIANERTGGRVQWNRDTEADRAVGDEVRSMLEGDLSADQAVQIALLNNRNLQATFEDLGVAQADLVEAGLLKNPLFHAERRFPGKALELDITEDFLSVFFLPLRKRIAESNFEATKLRVANAVLDLASRAREGFYELQGAEQILELRRSVVQATSASADAAKRLHDAGNMTDLNLANEQAAASMARLELGVAESGLQDQREHLNVLMGLWGDNTQWAIAARLPEPPDVELTSEGLETLAIRSRLDLAALRYEAEAFAQMLGLGRYAALTEVNITGHLEREPDGLTTFGPGLDIPLPVFNQGQPTRARYISQLRQALQRHAALAVEIRSSVRQERNHMLAARNRSEYYRKVLIPLRTTIVEQTQLEYNAMLVGVFQLLLAKQGQIDAGREYIESLRDYWISRTELERVVGARLESTNLRPAEHPEDDSQKGTQDSSSVPDHTQHQHTHGH